MITFAMAKGYTDSKQLASVETKTLASFTVEKVSGVIDFMGLVPGETYTVTMDGTSKAIVATYDTEQNRVNLKVSGGNIFDVLDDNTGHYTLVGKIGTEVTVQAETIHPIDQKFIPSMDSLTLVSPDGTSYKVTVDDSGNLTATAT